MKQHAENIKIDRRLVVRRRDENRLVRGELHAEKAGRINVRVKNQRVVIVGMGLEKLKQAGRVGALLHHPFDFIEIGVRIRVKLLRKFVEGARLALAVGRKAMDADAVDKLDSGGIFVFPRNVIFGAGRDDLHLGKAGEPSDHRHAMRFGSARDVRAVALNDDCEFH